MVLKNEPKTAEEIRRTVIWHNKYIIIGNKSVFIRKLYENDLLFIDDIVDKNGHFISYATLINKFGKHIDQFYYTCLKSSIPHKWCKLLYKKFIHVNPHEETLYLTIHKDHKPIQLVKSRQIYWMLHNRKIIIPNCIKRWHEMYDITFSEQKWKQIFTLSQNLSDNTKLIEFQFKIIHRVYASDSYVSNFDQSVNSDCKSCNVKNNIQHLFADCVNVKSFWLDFADFISNIEEKDIVLTSIDIIFGVTDVKEYILNYLILHAKWYIHMQKQTDQNVFFYLFLKYLKVVLVIEERIACNKKMLKYFNNNLGRVLECV